MVEIYYIYFKADSVNSNSIYAEDNLDSDVNYKSLSWSWINFLIAGMHRTNVIRIINGKNRQRKHYMENVFVLEPLPQYIL